MLRHHRRAGRPGRAQRPSTRDAVLDNARRALRRVAGRATRTAAPGDQRAGHHRRARPRGSSPRPGGGSPATSPTRPPGWSACTTPTRDRSPRAASTGRSSSATRPRSSTTRTASSLDYTVEEGNPADAPQLAPAIQRIAERLGQAPRAVTADRGYGEARVEAELRELGVKTVAIPRKGQPGAARRATEHSRGFRELVKWRTGCEGRISHLKHRYGWARSGVAGRDRTATWCGHGDLRPQPREDHRPDDQVKTNENPNQPSTHPLAGNPPREPNSSGRSS